MNLFDEIESANRIAQQSILRVARELADDAIAHESQTLRADDALRAAVSIGEADARSHEAARILATAYRDRDDAPAINLFQFLNDVYRKAAWRLGAFAYRGQADLDRLQEELKEAKEKQLGNLSESTVTTLESILESEREAVDARSARDVEKRSFIHVRHILHKQENTRRDLRDLGVREGADLDRVYGALEKMRVRIQAHQRHRSETFEKGQAQLSEFMEAFLAALQEPVIGMTRLGAEPLPDAAHLEDLPLTDWANLMETVFLILAADDTIVPQDGDHPKQAFPMPRVVVIPVAGYVLAAVNLAVTKYRENVIFFPLRCLEDPVAGLAREILKLRRKMHPRLMAVYRDEFNAYAHKHEALETGFDDLYTRFLRFCLGDEDTTRALGKPERRALREHFLPAFTRDLFVPPLLRTTLRRCVAGTPEGRLAFNREVANRQEDHFVAGVLYADRAEKYRALLADAQKNRRRDAELERKYIASVDTARKAALRFFNRAFRTGDHGRFALYNTGLVLRDQAEETAAGPDRTALREKAAYLFEKSLADAPLDLWSFKAAAFARECRAGDPAPEPEPQTAAGNGATAAPRADETGDFSLDDEDSSLFEWLRGKITGKR
ncbi:MAG: hypothetical protein ACOCX4_04945 [Planctomycetota bacterium]